jgi:hypothetical protein
LLISLLLAAFIAGQDAAAAEPVQLQADADVATAGYFQLRWDADSSIDLEESSTPDFDAPRLVYSGPDKARVMSGKSDGNWYYRARQTGSGSQWSKVVKVTVLHHPVERALGYFAVGAVVFLATLLIITKGARLSA